MQADGGAAVVLARYPAPPGFEYRTRILHSVQLTPVEDRYRVVQGRIYGWQERTMSHNAGLPSLRPVRGRFYLESPWMIYEGTGDSFEQLFYRVGTEYLGRNEMYTEQQGWCDLWQKYSGELLHFFVQREPLARAWATACGLVL